MTAQIGYKPVRFLVVDDDQVSIMSIKRTLKKLGYLNPIEVASDGVDALEYLQAQAAAPDMDAHVVLLDLSMPRMTGFEFLEILRKDDKLKHVVVFILTHSDSANDINEAYDKHVAGYIVKGNAPAAIEEALELLGIYSKILVLPTDD